MEPGRRGREDSEKQRGKERSNRSTDTETQRQSWRKRQEQLRGNEGTVETGDSREGGAGREVPTEWTSGDQLPGSPIFGLRITSSVALLKISLLTFTSAGPYTPARTEVSPRERMETSPTRALPRAHCEALNSVGAELGGQGPPTPITLVHHLLAVIL